MFSLGRRSQAARKKPMNYESHRAKISLIKMPVMKINSLVIVNLIMTLDTDPGCDGEHRRGHIVDISIFTRFSYQP